jgi:hypothetical protein
LNPCNLRIRKPLIIKGTILRFMGSLHGFLTAHWGHEPDRMASDVRGLAQCDRFILWRALAARWVGWFRSATRVLIGELVLPAGEVCPPSCAAGHQGRGPG